MEAKLNKLEREIEAIAVQQRDLAVQEREIGKKIQHSQTMVDQSTMEHKRANDEINRVALAGGVLTVDMLTARNALENKMNGFQTTYNEATTALSKCHEELQAATEARSSKIEEARGLREAIRREAERIEKERQDALKKKREEEAEKKRKDEAVKQKQRQEALEKKRKEEDEERKRIAREKEQNEENERKEREAKQAEAKQRENERAALAQAQRQDELEAMEAAKSIQGEEAIGPVERTIMREFFPAAQIIGDDIDALFGDDNTEQAAQSNALPMLAGMTGDLPPTSQQDQTTLNSAVQQHSSNTTANLPVVSSAEPQEGGNGAAVTSTTPLEQQQPEGSQLQETENAAPPTASSVAEQPQRSATLARLHATNSGPPSSSSAPLAASPSRKRIVEVQLPASAKRTKRSGIDLDDLMALQHEEQIDWLAAFLRRNSRVITNSFVMTAWAMETIHDEGLQHTPATPTSCKQNSGSDQDIVVILDSDENEDEDESFSPTPSRASTASPPLLTREIQVARQAARGRPEVPAAAPAVVSHRSSKVFGIGPLARPPTREQQQRPRIPQQQQRSTPQRQRTPQQRTQEQQEQDEPRLIKQYSIAKLVTRGLSERQAEQYRSMPLITDRVCPICEKPKEMSWANIAQHALACAVNKKHSSQRVTWTVEMKDLYIERSSRNDNHKSKKVNVGARRQGR